MAQCHSLSSPGRKSPDFDRFAIIAVKTPTTKLPVKASTNIHDLKLFSAEMEAIATSSRETRKGLLLSLVSLSVCEVLRSQNMLSGVGGNASDKAKADYTGDRCMSPGRNLAC